MYPDFLCIGAQKSGTTWLHSNLSMHRQIWLPPVKEIHYLDRKSTPLVKLLCSDSKRSRKARSHLLGQLRAFCSGGQWSELSWALRYCLAPRDDVWYRSLFPEIPGRITGEICPGYARLRGDEVGRIHGLMPSARIIYFIRNPIERSWSYAVQHFTSPRWKNRYGSVSNVPKEELLAFLCRDRTGHSDYLGALSAWGTHYGEEQMLLVYFDELVRNPKDLLKRILDFLGIDSSDNAIPKTVAMNRNPSRGTAAPPEMQSYLARLHIDQLAELHGKLNNSCTSAWLRSAQEALGGNSPGSADGVANDGAVVSMSH